MNSGMMGDEELTSASLNVTFQPSFCGCVPWELVCSWRHSPCTSCTAGDDWKTT